MRVLAVVGLALALPMGAAAQELPASPYQARVPVARQAPDEFQRAAAAGMAEVLVRVAGRADITAEPAVSQALGTADRYVEQFRYEVPAEGGLLLDLRFAPAAIQALVRSAAPAGTASAEAVLMRVDGIATFPDYAQLLGYLSRVGGRPQLVQVQGEVVTVAVRPVGGAELFARQLAADQRLLEVPVAVITDGSAGARSYRWQRTGG
jgi:hypothetical protein